MLCEQCQELEATTFLIQIINGKRARLNLCARCAAPVTDQLSVSGVSVQEFPLGSAPLAAIAPDPDRPTSVTIPDPVAVRVLASELDLKPFEVIQGLMCLNTFATPESEIDFSAAAVLCSCYGVTARKAS